MREIVTVAWTDTACKSKVEEIRNPPASSSGIGRIDSRVVKNKKQVLHLRTSGWLEEGRTSIQMFAAFEVEKKRTPH